MMVGEHDWYLDMGEKWSEMFGPDRYSFDHKGVHFVVLNSVVEKDFWTAKGYTPEERMAIVAGLDDNRQSPFEVGESQRDWLAKDLAKVDKKTPVIVFSHSPLYKLYKPWNFWTDDAEQVQALLKPFETVSVIHGHTHQLLTNRIGNIHFHGLLSTAWPWPYAPEGLPEYTVQMYRADPFNQFDGCGDGTVDVLAGGRVDKHYNLWTRNPRAVTAEQLASNTIPGPAATTVRPTREGENMRRSTVLLWGSARRWRPRWRGSGERWRRDNRARRPSGRSDEAWASRTVWACDRRKMVVVEGVRPDEKMPPARAQLVADVLMDLMRYCDEEITARIAVDQRITVRANGLVYEDYVPGGDLPIVKAGYGQPTQREQMIWKAELDKLVAEGDRLFHSDEIGTNGVACAMCHPHATGTHPETYPKFQTQLKKVALLRDMVNWCIINPLEGHELDHDDARMKALEAYIFSQRAGAALEAGKH